MQGETQREGRHVKKRSPVLYQQIEPVNKQVFADFWRRRDWGKRTCCRRKVAFEKQCHSELQRDNASVLAVLQLCKCSGGLWNEVKQEQSAYRLLCPSLFSSSSADLINAILNPAACLLQWESVVFFLLPLNRRCCSLLITVALAFLRLFTKLVQFTSLLEICVWCSA